MDPEYFQATVKLPKCAGPSLKARTHGGVFSRRVLLAAIAIAAIGHAKASPVSEIRVDWATYNPVSIVLKDKKILEEEFAKDGIGIR